MTPDESTEYPDGDVVDCFEDYQLEVGHDVTRRLAAASNSSETDSADVDDSHQSASHHKHDGLYTRYNASACVQYWKERRLKHHVSRNVFVNHNTATDRLCLITQLTYSRLHMLQRIAKHWQGTCMCRDVLVQRSYSYPYVPMCTNTYVCCRCVSSSRCL